MEEEQGQPVQYEQPEQQEQQEQPDQPEQPGKKVIRLRQGYGGQSRWIW